MKAKKNKIVFISVLVVLVLFITAYALLTFGGRKTEESALKHTELPSIDEEDHKEYKSRLEAVNDLQEVRERATPGLYDERLIDSMGYYDPDLEAKEKQQLVDDLLGEESSFEKAPPKSKEAPSKGSLKSNSGHNRLHSSKKETAQQSVSEDENTASKSMDHPHEPFFDARSTEDASKQTDVTGEIPVLVDGDQVVRANSRLRMRLQNEAVIAGKVIPRNTLVYGFVSLQPNRLSVTIEHIDQVAVALKAYDFEDGSEGIYIENNLRAELQNEVLDDALGGLSLPGAPGVGKVTNLLRRKNRNIKFTVLHNYQLILKPE